MTLLRRVSVTWFAIAALAPALGAQEVSAPAPHPSPGEYQPSYHAQKGREIVAVFISSATCVANFNPAFKPAVREMMRRLGAQRDSLGVSLSIMGVATDWVTRDALAYLQGFGEFDELDVGRNWFNGAVVHHVWEAAGGQPSVPQVVLLERTIDDGSGGSNRVTVSPERVLARFVGGDQIQAWVARGAPLPAVVPAAVAAAPRR
jgi:hypothetical protein